MTRFTAVRALVSACAMSLLPLALSAQTFEGAISMHFAARGSQPGADMEYLNRSGNVRVNINSPMGPVALLHLAAEQKTYMVIESQKTYVEMSTADAAAATAAIKAADVKITKSGRKETIAGYECEHVLIETANANGPQKTDVCMTQALGRYVNPVAAMGANVLTPWQRQLVADGGFPLKVTGNDGVVIVEVTKIEKKRVSDTQFRIPPDFNKMDMPKRP